MWISVIEPKEIGESCIKLIHSSKPLRIVQILRIRSSGKCLSSANMFSTTMHLYTNAKPNLWNVAVFISTGQNAYVIRQNNIKQRRYASIISSQNERNFPDNLIHWPGYGAILSSSNLEMYLHRWGRKNSAKISQIIIQKKNTLYLSIKSLSMLFAPKINGLKLPSVQTFKVYAKKGREAKGKARWLIKCSKFHVDQRSHK